ncbi:hypothetical protein [Agaribacterium haliotis]|uniref:hypothetical protein n=1 Tax=Agaribacterium haliotis TaxID=2013869 RepID=UPI0011788F13|nr:hypothetical protein [Agaribacterium haliotis]
MLKAAQIQLLLQALNERRNLELWQAQRGCSCTALLLGADIQEHSTELLLSTANDLRANEHFKLRLKGEQQDLICELSRRQAEHGLYTCTLISCHWSANRRWEQRLNFANWQGPEVQLEQDFSPAIRGHLRDLSSRGLAVDFWLTQLEHAPLKASRHTLTLNFNEHFCLSLNCELLDCSLHRRPGMHRRLRFYISEGQALQKCQLHALLESATQKRTPALAA